MSEVTGLTQHVDLTAEELVQRALERQEGELSANKALAVTTGHRTGRSPKDRFIVSDANTKDSIDWGPVNQPFEQAHFTQLWQRAEQFIQDKEHFISNLRVGADEQYYLPVKVITEYAWHNLFVRHLFIREADPGDQKQWTILNTPSLLLNPEQDHTRTDGAVIINFTEKKVLVCGMRYAGEMKKSMFSVLNYILTEQDVLPMHCAANSDDNGNVALFFGLSGTGKTTLSADPDRHLIGDDEHGWGPTGVFNFEGGCYAKCIDLSQEREPVIWNAIRDGSIMENVVLDKDTKQPNYADDSLTQNTRAAYPREFIPKRVDENKAGHPNAVLFLTCDLYGVLPPIARLTPAQAAYYFLSGYTALVGSTEVGGPKGIQPTFSRCFGAPFFPRPAQVYADLLMKRVHETGAQIYLVNTGWTGGGFGVGQRFAIPTTRAVVSAAVNGTLKNAQWQTVEHFNFEIPTQITGVDSQLLNPVNTWKDNVAFDENVAILIEKFQNNFTQYDVADDIRNAGPHFDQE